MIKKNEEQHAEIYRRLKDTAAVSEALKRAAQETIADHARAGHKIVIWRDDQIIWADPNGESPSNE